MQPFTSHTGIAVPLIRDDINTDEMSPVQAMREMKPDYRKLLFMRTRAEQPDFVLNRPQFQNAGILITGHNFGAGSSREAAVWGMLANNIRVIVAKSFADIYRENCLQNGLLPVVLGPGDADAFIARVVAANGSAPFTVDLETQTIGGPGGPAVAFDISAADRMRRCASGSCRCRRDLRAGACGRPPKYRKQRRDRRGRRSSAFQDRP